MTAKHTPGPWKFKRSADYEHMMQTLGKPCEEHAGYFRDNDGTWGISDSTGLRVASASFKGTSKRGQAWQAPDPEGMANARLIAAAPDLLEALERHSQASATNPCHCGPSCRCIWHMTEAAIKKARGL